MALNFGGINIGGSNGGGGGGTPESYIKSGTIITVGTDKDYQTIQSAYNSLGGKWSDGTVTIKIDDGTYNEKLTFAKAFNIPSLIVEGTSKAGTIINGAVTSDYNWGWELTNQKAITLKNLTYNGIASRNDIGILIDRSGTITLENIAVNNTQYYAISLLNSSVAYISTNGITISNSGVKGAGGIHTSNCSHVHCKWGIAISVTNCTIGIMAENCGMNCFANMQYTSSSVTTPWSPALNSTSAANAWNVNN